MAEQTSDLRGLPKPDAYARLLRESAAILEGMEGDSEAVQATLACLLHHGFGHLWSGFYRVVKPGLLRVGAYQGTLGCLEIPFGKGVCGTAAAERRTVVVADVYAFPGHITCDGRSASEIVVPWFDRTGQLIAVLDLDSERKGAFDAFDAAGLEALLAHFSPPAAPRDH